MGKKHQDRGAPFSARMLFALATPCSGLRARELLVQLSVFCERAVQPPSVQSSRYSYR